LLVGVVGLFEEVVEWGWWWWADMTVGPFGPDSDPPTNVGPEDHVWAQWKVKKEEMSG